MRIDLHTHSTMSDGTVRPSALVQLAAASGLDVVAITDHDSVAGWAEASDAARDADVALVPGIELSTIYEGAGVHLLGYLFDPTYPPLAAELALIIEGRDGRLEAMVSQLRGVGIDISVDDVLTQAAEAAAIGRPHVADALVAKGVAPDRTSAFEQFLHWGRPGHVVRYATQTRDMIQLINGAGGAAVIAHPWGRGSRRVLDRDVIAELAEIGLAGLEVHHLEHSEADTDELSELALESGLVMTGSSDFHGAGKVGHDLGSHVTDPAQYERLLALAAEHAAASGRIVSAVVR